MVLRIIESALIGITMNQVAEPIVELTLAIVDYLERLNVNEWQHLQQYLLLI